MKQRPPYFVWAPGSASEQHLIEQQDKVGEGLYYIPNVGVMAVDNKGQSCIVREYVTSEYVTSRAVTINRSDDDRRPWSGMRRLRLRPRR